LAQVRETYPADNPSTTGSDSELRFPLTRPPTRRGPIERLLRSQLLWLAIYYIVVLGVAILLIRNFPAAREALVVPSIPALGEGAAIISGGDLPVAPPTSGTAVRATLDRALTTFLVIFGAIVLAIPVAWVYMWTKRLRYDPGLVRSVIILPIAVAGILLVVKNSLAIAFSLAGIVAAVRFRNTLKDPQDAVYIFLTIAIGISAGVQALDVAIVVSVVFNLVVITMWKFQVGSVHGGSYARTGVLSIGDSALLVARTPEACRSVRREVIERAGEIDADGVILVHSLDAELARHTIQDALSESAEDWRLLGIFPRGEEVQTAEYLVQLASKTTPIDLMATLDEWSTHILAAEYIPFRQRKRARGPDGADLKQNSVNSKADEG
jgi:hypothetical protein